MDFNQNNLEFTENFLVGLAKLHCVCPEEHLQSNIFERRCWNL